MIAIEGPSGVGKTTMASALARALGARRIAEAYDRLEPPRALSFSGPRELVGFERRLLREEARRYREAERARRAGESVVLDTGYLGPLTYTAGIAREDARYLPALRAVGRTCADMVRSGSLALPDVIVLLGLPDSSTEARRARASATHPARWKDRHRAVARWERTLWLTEGRKVERLRILAVPARGTPEVLLARILRALERFEPRPPVLRTRLLSLVASFSGARPPRRLPASSSRAGPPRQRLKAVPGLAGSPDEAARGPAGEPS